MSISPIINPSFPRFEPIKFPIDTSRLQTSPAKTSPFPTDLSRQISPAKTSPFLTDPSPSPEIKVDVIINLTKPNEKSNNKTNNVATEILVRRSKRKKFNSIPHEKTKPNQKLDNFQLKRSPRPSDHVVPTSPLAEDLFNKALVLRYDNNFKAASDFAKKAISINPHVCDYYCLLGSCLMAEGSLLEALSYMELGAFANPKESRYHLYIAGLQKNYFGNLAKAESHCRTCISLEPDNHESHLFLAEILLVGNFKIDEAIHHCNEAKRLSSQENSKIDEVLQKLVERKQNEEDAVQSLLSLHFLKSS
ncbi:MAG: tetratricopeptide repeat protein [Parachlamydiales bacterium]|jgi:tetratricopeptide (TPR) repeat protein